MLDLGGAGFRIEGDPTPLIRAFEQAEAASRQGTSKITQDVQRLSGNIERSLDQIAKSNKFRISLTVDSKAGEQSVARLESAIGRIKSGQTILLNIKGDQALQQLNKLESALHAAEQRGAKIDVQVDTRAATQKIDELSRRGGGIGGALRGGAEIVGAGAIAGGGLAAGAAAFNAAREAVGGLVTNTVEAQRAQRALGIVYAESGGQIADITGKIAGEFHISRTESDKAAVGIATLVNNYGQSVDQQEALLRRTAEIGKVLGISFPEAAKRAGDALRGEAEASELLGVSLQSDVVKATGDMTAAQRKSWETLDGSTKRQITLTEFLKQTAQFEGAAAASSGDLGNAMGRLGAATTDLSSSLGEAAAGPIAAFINQVAAGAERLNELSKAVDESNKRSVQHQRQLAAANQAGGASGQFVQGLINQVMGIQPEEATPPEPRQGRIQGPTPAEVRTNLLAQLRQRQAEGDLAIKEAQRVVEADKEAIDKRIEFLNDVHDVAIKAANDREKAELKTIDDITKAQLAANKEAIADAERRKDAEIRASQDRHTAVVDALDDEARRFASARQIEDRERSQARENQDRTITDQRTQQDQALKDDREAALRSLRAQEEARSRSVEHEIRDIERRTEAAVRGLDQEAEAARDAAQSAIRGIEDQQRTEDARHRQRMDNLAREEERALGAIDQRLRALDDEQRKEQERAQDAALSETRNRARRGLGAAQRVGDPAAIQRAQKAVDDAQTAIDRERAQRQRDARRRRLQDEADAVRKEFDQKRKAIEDEDRRRQEAADAEKRRIQDELAAKLDEIAQRKQSVQDDSKAQIEAIRANDQTAKDAFDAEMQRTTDLYAERERQRTADRQAEDRSLQDSRAAEDQRLQDGRKAQDDDIRLRREAADKALEADRRAIDESYNGKDGILTTLRKATEDINAEHDKQAESVRTKYDDIRTNITNTWKTAVDGLKTAREDMEKDLKQQVADWGTWKTGTIGEIQSVIDKVNELIKRIEAIPGGQTPKPVAPGEPGGGQALPAANGNLAYGPVVRNATADSYWTSGGTHGGHPAADIFAPAGSAIYAPVGGQLEAADYPQGGHTGTLAGDDGRSYYFAHGRVPFDSGRVERGSQIGQVGNSGNASHTASHLHFAISEHGPGVFSAYNGSGDVMGDASYWGEGGTGVGHGDGDFIEVELFGQKYRILVAEAKVPGEVGKAIRAAIAAAGLPRDWELPMGEIAAIESGDRRSDGSAVIGTGDFKAFNGVLGASGLMQVIPGTFRAFRLASLPDDIFDPVANPAAAGRYIEKRYQSPYGTPYYETGRMDWRGVRGYMNGGPIREHTLLYGLDSHRVYAQAGEPGAGNEWVVPERDMAGVGGDGQPIVLQVNLDGRKIAEATHPHIRARQIHDDTLRH